MELIPDSQLAEINRLLDTHYGRMDDKPRYRVVFSEMEYEMRMADKTPEGFHLAEPKMMMLPKYRHYIQERYILERLTVVPTVQRGELAELLSYEPCWVFEQIENGMSYFLPPRFDVSKFVIENMEEAIRNKGNYTKYKDPEGTPEEAAEVRKQRIDQLQEVMFGNESEVTDALRYKEGVVVPRNYASTQSEEIN